MIGLLVGSLIAVAIGVSGCVIFGRLSNQNGEIGLVWLVPVLLSMIVGAGGVVGIAVFFIASAVKVWQ